MAILYVASEGFELEPFAQMLTGVRKLKWPIDYAFEGLWEGRRVLLAANGSGTKLAMQAVEVAIRAVVGAELSSSKLEAVISTGFCGSLDKNLQEGDIVLGTRVIDLATKREYVCMPVLSDKQFVEGHVLTQDRVALDTAEKTRLSESGIVVDMEAAAVAERAERAGLPFACIKAVYDRLDESFGFDLNQMRSEDGHISRGKISFYAVTHPKHIPELLRLKRRTQDASKMLGDFLVNCRITAEPSNTRAE